MTGEDEELNHPSARRATSHRPTAMRPVAAFKFSVAVAGESIGTQSSAVPRTADETRPLGVAEPASNVERGAVNDLGNVSRDAFCQSCHRVAGAMPE